VSARRRLGALVAAGSLVVLGACGIPVDTAPHDIADDALTAQGATASDTPASPSGQRVFFVAADPTGAVRLQAVRRDVPSAVSDVLGALFTGLTDTERTSRQLTTQIPVGTKLRSVNPLADGTVVIDVDAVIFEAKGANLTTAIGQIVYTATSVPGVERVRLLVDGQPQEWPAGDGRERAGDLTPLAFPALYPSNEPLLPPVPSPTGPTTLPPTTTPPSSVAPPPTTTTATPPVAVAPAPDPATDATAAPDAPAPEGGDDPAAPDDEVAANP
jgi:hypothetical protein